MTPTFTARQLVALCVGVLVLFALLAWSAGVSQRNWDRGDAWRARALRAEATVARLRVMGGQRPDGSGECRVGAFTTTSTTVAR